MVFRKKLVMLIAVSFVIRLLVACTLSLGNDEVYYFTYALQLQWNYFDHPPGVALLIRLATLNLWLLHEGFIRFGAVVCAATGTFLSYKIGCAIKNERTGFYAALLYNASIYSSIIAGVFVLPDSPQIVFWLVALLFALKLVQAGEAANENVIRNWVLFGVITGLCIQCKVHGVFLWFGLGLYIFFYRRRLLFQPYLYLSFLITLVIISPIVFWNINNHFVTWQYHSNRVELHHHLSINYNSLVQSLLGQLSYNNPVSVFIIAKALIRFKQKPFLSSPMYRLLLCMGLPIVIAVTIISVFNSTLPHWSAPGFVSLSFIAAAYIDEVYPKTNFRIPRLLKSSLLLIVAVVLGGMLLIQFYPGTIGNKEVKRYGSGDFTLDISGWSDIRNQYKKWLHTPVNNKYSNLKFVSDKWFPASHIEYYIAQPTGTKVIGVGTLDDLHNFAWLNKWRSDLHAGDSALCLVPSNYFTSVADTYKNTFTSFTKLHTFTTLRGGKPDRYFSLYLLQNYKPTDEVHTLNMPNE